MSSFLVLNHSTYPLIALIVFFLMLSKLAHNAEAIEYRCPEKIRAESFIMACEKGDVQLVSCALKKGLNTEVRDQWESTPLIAACARGREQVTTLLLQNGANCNAVNAFGNTPLISAVLGGFRDIISLLLTNGADINAKNVDGRTALVIAAMKGDENTIQILMNHIPSLDLLTKDGKTALYYAEINKLEVSVKLLLSKGALVREIDVARPDGRTNNQKSQGLKSSDEAVSENQEHHKADEL